MSLVVVQGTNLNPNKNGSLYSPSNQNDQQNHLY